MKLHWEQTMTINLFTAPVRENFFSRRLKERINVDIQLFPRSHGIDSCVDVMCRDGTGHAPQVSWGKLPTKTTQPTFRIGTLTSTFAGLKEDTCAKDSLAAGQR
ncbi:hypothetical protein TNCV_1487341 [Trichonephila clavipes]|nr:hypothetical protein TNCV_1487341 [Trichonephila clavipes]